MHVQGQPRRLASSGGHHYEPPTGNLFGEERGTKRKRTYFDYIYVFGFLAPMFYVAVIGYGKSGEDIQSWARVEAEKQLAAEGIQIPRQ